MVCLSELGCCFGQNSQFFKNWICFCHQVKVGESGAYSFVSLRQRCLHHWTSLTFAR
jgi:hypothetical protein